MDALLPWFQLGFSLASAVPPLGTPYQTDSGKKSRKFYTIFALASPKVPAPKQVKKEVYCLSQYFTELSLVDYSLAGRNVLFSVFLTI